jgi:hypothetical protein
MAVSRSVSGYTPVFSTVLDGTLYGKWPHTGVWLCILSQCDHKGEVDMVPALLANKIGIPLETLLECIAEFMSPDPGSRTAYLEGRRLELIDESRDWGWRVVNIQTYRAKAGSKNQVLDGRNAEKVKRYKQRHRKTPEDTAGHLGTPETLTHTHTHTHTHTETKEEKEIPSGLSIEAWKSFEAYRKGIGKPIKPVSVPAAMKALAKYGTEQVAVVEQSMAQGWTGLFSLKPVLNGGRPGYKTPRTTAEILAEEEHVRKSAN